MATYLIYRNGETVKMSRMHSNLSNVAIDALSIWKAGVAGVEASRACHQAISYESPYLIVDDEEFLLSGDSRIIVVGAGKAAHKMAEGVMRALNELGLADRVQGWVNVPAFPNAELLSSIPIHLHVARSIGSNLPTQAAAYGTQQIVRLLESARPHDLVICLLSGGGSSLLVDPLPGISLQQKIEITEVLSLAGANIHQLNTVRRAISNVKGGGLLRACKSEQLATLVVSDVLDDDLCTIASGPTNPDASPDLHAAIRVMEQLLGREHAATQLVGRVLSNAAKDAGTLARSLPKRNTLQILANNATAVDAAGVKAVELGYRYLMYCHRQSEGDAEDVGRSMAHHLDLLLKHSEVNCEIAGGEPTVNMQRLTQQSIAPGRGGRNQHVVLCAALEMLQQFDRWRNVEFCLLSGGTDGEDGNSGAAGAWIDRNKFEQLVNFRESAERARLRFNSAEIFERLDTAIDCGLTGTNVCDLRILLVR